MLLFQTKEFFLEFFCFFVVGGKIGVIGEFRIIGKFRTFGEFGIVGVIGEFREISFIIWQRRHFAALLYPLSFII